MTRTLRSTAAIGAALIALVLGITGCGGSTSMPAPTGTSSSSSAQTPSGNEPYWKLPEVPAFEVTSTTVEDGGSFALPQFSGVFGVPGGEDISPQLSWSGFPDETQSFVVTVYDIDAPTGSGFWHWVVSDIPASVTSLDENAGAEGGASLPAGAVALLNDAGAARYIGSAPPPGTGEHRYIITVSALDVPELEVEATASPALVGFMMGSHTIARGTLLAVAGE